MYLIFSNKPMLALFYVFGLLVLVLETLLMMQGLFEGIDVEVHKQIIMFAILFPFFLFPFNTLFRLSLIYWYLLRDNKEDLVVFGVDIRRFHIAFFAFLFTMWTIFLTCSMMGAFLSTNPWFGLTPFALMIFITICSGIFLSLIEAKFISYGLVKNKSFQDIKMDEIYAELRHLVVKKIVN